MLCLKSKQTRHKELQVTRLDSQKDNDCVDIYMDLILSGYAISVLNLIYMSMNGPFVLFVNQTL